MWEIMLLAMVVVLFCILTVQVLLQAGLSKKVLFLPFLEKRLRWSELEETRERSVPDRRECVRLFVIFLGFRLFLYFVSALIIMMNTGEGGVFGWDAFLEAWNRWDAQHYIKIANFGYAGAVEDGKHLFLVFFPLFPYIMRAVNLVTGDFRLAGMLVSTFAFCGGIVYLYKLVAYDYGKRIAENTVILLAVFPFAFFFGGIMTESLFLFVTAASLYYIRMHRWFLAVIFGGLASMTRMHGILLMIPAIVELFVVEKPIRLLGDKNYKRFFTSTCLKVLAMFGMMSGALYYFFENYRTTGNPFEFMIHQKNHWNQGFALFTETIAYHMDYVGNDNYDLSVRLSLWMTALALFVVSFALLVYGIMQIRSMYSCYFIVYFLINYSVTWLLSSGRYMSCAIPMFLVLGILADKGKVMKYALVVGSAMLCIVYMTGYLYGRHIM